MQVWVRESDLRCMADAQAQQFGAFSVNVRLIEPDDGGDWRAIHVQVKKDKG